MHVICIFLELNVNNKYKNKIVQRQLLYVLYIMYYNHSKLLKKKISNKIKIVILFLFNLLKIVITILELISNTIKAYGSREKNMEYLLRILS